MALQEIKIGVKISVTPSREEMDDFYRIIDSAVRAWSKKHEIPLHEYTREEIQRVMEGA